MLQLTNNTPFASHMFVSPNLQGIDTLYVVVKATYDLRPEIRIAEKQQPVIMEDIYWGEPGVSSLKYPTEIHLEKPGTDVIVIGEACAPHDKPVEVMGTAVSVAGKMSILKVFGDRYWKKGFWSTRPSRPQPFVRMPLTYERAFGGTHVLNEAEGKILSETRNPVGKGFLGKRDEKELEAVGVPNIEDYRNLVRSPKSRPRPMGYGSIAPSWEPRMSYIGTYDAKWKKTRAPYLPLDFDSRFFHTAHPDLIFQKHLKGGEPVMINFMSPKGHLNFNLPACEPRVEVNIVGRFETAKAHLETVILEPTDDKMSLVWRTATTSGKKITGAEAEVTF